MISGYCFVPETVQQKLSYEQSLDNCWPHMFGAVPRKGDMVQSCDGICLTVVDIIHYDRGARNNERPAIRVVLGEPILYLKHTDY
jgi:hypothetical protein